MIGEIDSCCTLVGKLSCDGGLNGKVNGTSNLTGKVSDTASLSGKINLYTPPTYHGVYEVTPSPETQILGTQGKLLEEDVVVNPIPSNYGLITWNGVVITVS